MLFFNDLYLIEMYCYPLWIYFIMQLGCYNTNNFYSCFLEKVMSTECLLHALFGYINMAVTFNSGKSEKPIKQTISILQ